MKIKLGLSTGISVGKFGVSRPGGAVSYSISGIVFDSDGSTPVSGATITLGLSNTTSAGNGTYSITGLAAGTSGNLTVTKTGYIYGSIAVSSMTGNLTSQNFTAKANNVHTWFDYSDATLLYTDSGLTTLVTADGDVLGGVRDKSGNAHNLTQGTTSKKPIYKVNIYNGLSTGRWDGTDDTMATSAFTELPQPNTIWIVIKSGVGNAFQSWCDGILINKRHVAGHPLTSGNAGLFAGTGFGAADTDTAINVWCGIFNTASSTLYKNGVSFATGNAGSHGLTGVTLGNSYDGSLATAKDICEYVLKTGVASAGELSAMQAYLKAKWGTP